MEIVEMATVKLGGGITDIKGTIGGVYFHRDKSGVHVCRQPRNIRRLSSAQLNQRRAFMAARAYNKDERFVSWNIYRALNGLPMSDPPPDYQIPRM